MMSVAIFSTESAYTGWVGFRNAFLLDLLWLFWEPRTNSFFLMYQMHWPVNLLCTCRLFKAAASNPLGRLSSLQQLAIQACQNQVIIGFSLITDSLLNRCSVLWVSVFIHQQNRCVQHQADLPEGVELVFKPLTVSVRVPGCQKLQMTA